MKEQIKQELNNWWDKANTGDTYTNNNYSSVSDIIDEFTFEKKTLCYRTEGTDEWWIIK